MLQDLLQDLVRINGVSQSHFWLKFCSGPFYLLYSHHLLYPVSCCEKPLSPNLRLITQQDILYYVRRNCQAISLFELSS